VITNITNSLEGGASGLKEDSPVEKRNVREILAIVCVIKEESLRRPDLQRGKRRYFLPYKIKRTDRASAEKKKHLSKIRRNKGGEKSIEKDRRSTTAKRESSLPTGGDYSGAQVHWGKRSDMVNEKTLAPRAHL